MTTLLQIAFWVSVLLLVQVFAGYPLEMWLLARWRPRPIGKRSILPTVTVVIAVHDGAAQIEAKLANLAALNYPREALDIVIACDGCTDATAALARGCGDTRVQVLEFAERRGKAACLNDAVAQARGDVLLMTDVRQRLAPDALRELVANFADVAVGAVSGELHLEDAQTGFARGVDAYWRYEKLIRHAESRSGSVVGVTGALYAIRRSLFRPLPPGTVLDDVLVPMRVVAAGRRVVFEPAALAWDRPSQQPAQEQRRKIRTLAGNFQLVQLAPWLLLPWRNPLWLRFIGHKLLRLLAPWLLLTMAVTSALLANRYMECALVLAGVICGAILLTGAHLWPALARPAPVRLLRAFCYLNLFTAQALLAYLRNRRLHLW